MKISLGFSPCPNDTFIFDALVNRKIDTQGLDFEYVLEDVETLNQWALAGKLDVSKISYGVLPLVTTKFNLLDAGGALGKGVGPLLIAKKQIPREGLKNLRVAIPGKNTSAHILFSLAFPEVMQKTFMVFSGIEDAVIREEVDAGVIIHENRFTYAKKGLVKLMDLGSYWEEETGCPIPLGGIIIKKEFESDLQKTVDDLIKKSVLYAFSNYPSLPPFVKENAQEMDESVMRQHIDLYVNDYTVSLGESGKNAVNRFISVYEKLNQQKSLTASGESNLY
ncbi:MAG: 1,4-dihydroxy-6-naphthoate synthase [Bacteroidetes bacterium]|nr:MAG: 1,4-dihydroxy-6-naphthoate synthase [Bacteroidota bacterium]